MSNTKVLLFSLMIFVLQRTGVGSLTEELDSIYEQFELMGLSVITMCHGDVQDVYHKGLKDYTRSLSINNNTMYRIASISKLVTSTGLMTLYDRGLFSLDEDISISLGYLVRNPNWPDVPITYRMLLSHTSSLQDGTGYDAFISATVDNLGSPPNLKEILLPGGLYFTEDMWRTERPGSYFIYCNLNFGVVGTLIEVMSGLRFDIYMKEYFLNKLETIGSFNVRDIEDIDDLAVLYRNEDGWTPQYDNYQGIKPEPLNITNYIPGTNGLQFSPTGGLRISPLDLAKVMQVHISNGTWGGEQLISESAINLMREVMWKYSGTNGVTEGGLYQAWGLGLHHATNSDSGDTVFPDRYMYGHMGEAYGLVSDFYYDVASGAGVVFMTNGLYNGISFGSGSAFYAIEERVFQAVYENLNC